MRLRALVLATVVVLPAALAAQQSATVRVDTTETVVLRAARLIDGTGGPVVQNGVVVVKGDKIVAAGAQSAVAIPAGARVVDLGDATLLPGFIDAHTHII